MECPHAKSVDHSAFQLAVKLSIAVATKNTQFFPACSTCGSPDAMCCLECPLLACSRHIAHEHNISVCLWPTSQGYVWCSACKQFVTDKVLEQLRLKQVQLAISGDEIQLPNPNKMLRPKFNAQLGLRGFYNMGATCYMAVVLQTLIHNPLVSQFFLSGGHDRTNCPRHMCVQCCVDEIYCEFFSGESTESCGLPDLLRAVVKASSSMFSGASEQDAHEFLQFLLDQFHQTHYSPNGQIKDEECACISHRAFAGSLQNNLHCTSCDYDKTLDDALMDISLEISGDTLEECLRKFTSPETLGNYECGNCSKKGTVTKQFFIQRLPPILQIQLKRFKHEGVSSKVEKHVQFPLILDLTNYTTSPESSRPYVYELFGVLCHYGSLDTGHYTCMMKHSSGVWYQFDDTVVSPVDVSHVLNSGAYLLFYCTHWAV